MVLKSFMSYKDRDTVILKEKVNGIRTLGQVDFITFVVKIEFFFMKCNLIIHLDNLAETLIFLIQH